MYLELGPPKVRHRGRAGWLTSLQTRKLQFPKEPKQVVFPTVSGRRRLERACLAVTASLEESRAWPPEQGAFRDHSFCQRRREGGSLLEPISAPSRTLWAGDYVMPTPTHVAGEKE